MFVIPHWKMEHCLWNKITRSLANKPFFFFHQPFFERWGWWKLVLRLQKPIDDILVANVLCTVYPTIVPFQLYKKNTVGYESAVFEMDES